MLEAEAEAEDNPLRPSLRPGQLVLEDLTSMLTTQVM